MYPSFCAPCLPFPQPATADHPKPAATTSSTTKRYPLKGKVISIDPQAATASINNEPIPNFMGPMAMPYPIKPPAALAQLQPGDTIAAEVVVQPDNIYWLENVKVTAHSSAPADKHTAEKDRRSK